MDSEPAASPVTAATPTPALPPRGLALLWFGMRRTFLELARRPDACANALMAA